MIKIENVSKTYNKNRRTENKVLDKASLELPNEGFVFFVGRSGTGKSTMLNAIGGLIGYEGKILFDKEEVQIEKYRRRNIGYIFQNFLLFGDLSIYENIKIALNLIGIYNEKEIAERTKVLLKAVELDVNPTRRASALSLGQQQRVAIARALASNPKIILADEPTGNLDSKNSIIVMNILKKLSKNHLVICVTHNLGLVNRYADLTFQIQDQKLVSLDKTQSKEIMDSEVNESIDIANMSQKEFDNGDFLIKLYTQASDKTASDEIKIVRQNGRILVIGNNISIASNEEIDFTKTDEDIQVEISDQGEIDLDFEETKDAKTFKDGSLYSNFIQRFHRKRSKKAFFTSLTNIFFPLLLFILFNLLIGQFNALNASVPVAEHDNIVYLNDVDNYPSSQLLGKQLAEFIENDDTHIESVLNGAGQYSSETYSLDSAINLTAFSLVDDIISNPSGLDTSSLKFNMEDVDAYSSFDFADQLKAFDLKDNDILIDQSLVDQIETSAQNPAFIYGNTLENEILNSTFTCSYANWNNDVTTKTYTIVGIVDTGLNFMYTTENTALDFDYTQRLANSNYYYEDEYYDDEVFKLKASQAIDNPIELSYDFFGNFEFVEYEDVKDDPNYSIFSSEELEHSSEYSSEYPYIIVSNNISEDKTNALSNLNFDIFDNSYASIADTRDSDAQVICFFDYTNSEGTEVDSSSQFVHQYLSYTSKKSAFSYAPSDLSMLDEAKVPAAYNEIAFPSSLQSVINIADFNKDSAIYTATGFYDDSLFVNQTIATSKLTILASTINSISISYYSNPSELLADSYSYVISSNPEATIKFFDDNPSYGLKVFTYDEIYDEYTAENANSQTSGYISAISIMGGIFLLIVIMSNISKVNKEKLDIGILRCLGYSKLDLVNKNTSAIFVDSLVEAIIPCFIFGILLAFFNLYTLGWLWTFVFIVGYFLVMYLTSNIPLFVLLRKKPVEIINSLN